MRWGWDTIFSRRRRSKSVFTRSSVPVVELGGRDIKHLNVGGLWEDGMIGSKNRPRPWEYDLTRPDGDEDDDEDEEGEELGEDYGSEVLRRRTDKVTHG